MEWEYGNVHTHMGWTITATLVPEHFDHNAVPDLFAKVWVTRDPFPIGFVMSRKFNTVEEAIEYIEHREVNKTLWRIKNGQKYRL